MSQTIFTFCIYRITCSSLKVLAIVLMVNFVNDFIQVSQFLAKGWTVYNCKQKSTPVWYNKHHPKAAPVIVLTVRFFLYIFVQVSQFMAKNNWKRQDCLSVSRNLHQFGISIK